ncbi:uncharacterized protein LOC131217418 [Magnolia sinica]|uniref:uncharacterized protein LOC131217418 n=1 Tax=Magnolia sinica TaxID=86752 RepID=UPI00265B3029|nr:uncharacterized protein LOC131217418 [Magnolia sinica]
MLVLGVNSKRQRRPNVRLVEIGDGSAAFSCGIPQKLKGNWEKGLKLDRVSQFGASEPGVSPRVSAEAHNRENRNPNSGKTVWEFTCSDDVDVVKPELDFGEFNPNLDSGAASLTCDFGAGKPKSKSGAVNPKLGFGTVKPKLDFGTVTRRGRVMKRRGRSTRGNSGIGSVWNSRASPDISNRNDDFAIGLKDSSYQEASDMSKDACDNECFGPVSDMQMPGDLDGFQMWNGYCKESNGLSSDYGDFSDHKISKADRVMVVGTVVNSVGVWLEELGFGRYAGVFEMHEVDEETLPLLTLEDLKEMGINAVGPRRKIFTAIQLLKETSSAQ